MHGRSSSRRFGSNRDREREDMRRRLALIFVSVLALLFTALPAGAAPKPPDKHPEAIGRGGAVATVDPIATDAGLAILRRGGNAVDAAVAAAAVLGVTEPYSAGIGGGGFMVIYLADTGEVVTIDGREEAPSDPDFDADVFLEDGVPIPFFPERITSGLAVGVPGTLATWVDALDRYGTISLAQALQPGRVVAQRGFVVDQTFADQTAGNLERFQAITSTAETFLVDGEVPGSRLRVPQPRPGPDVPAAATARAGRFLPRPAGRRDRGDGAESARRRRSPVRSPSRFDGRRRSRAVPGAAPRRRRMTEYRGLDVFGMGPPSSGGITVGESSQHRRQLPARLRWTTSEFQHHVLEATALAFADRNAYIGDDRPQYNYVPVDGSAVAGLCRRAGGAHRSGRRRRKAGRPRQPVPLRREPAVCARCGCARRGRRHVDDPSGHGGPVGQRRLVHADDRIDRWQRYHGAGSGLPAQQRADGLQLDR